MLATVVCTEYVLFTVLDRKKALLSLLPREVHKIQERLFLKKNYSNSKIYLN